MIVYSTRYIRSALRQLKKVLKSKKAPPNAAQMKAKRMASAKARLQERGNDIDDIADVLLQRWEQ